MADRIFVLNDPATGAAVGMHIVAAELDVSPDEIAEMAGEPGSNRLRVEVMAAEQVRAAADTAAGTEAGAGGGGTQGHSTVELLPTKFERSGVPMRRK
jgi:hypothetical protein